MTPNRPLTKQEAALLAKYPGIVNQYEIACRYSRRHSELAAFALATHGDHGASISGCVRDHFPLEVKNKLRMLATACSVACEGARAARPLRVRMATVRTIGQIVAARDGCGFYGPSPRRASV